MTKNFIPSWLEGKVYIHVIPYTWKSPLLYYNMHYDMHKQVTVLFRFGELRWTKIPSSLETESVDKKRFINFISTNEGYRRRLRTM